jgi:hypothetical protein
MRVVIVDGAVRRFASTVGNAIDLAAEAYGLCVSKRKRR